MLKISNYY